MSHMQSSGRGGAGNIVDSSKAPQIQPEDLKTPTLKTSSMVTTGRGGTGNMAANLDADEKRRRQDVEPVVRRDSHGITHVGRGGTGNAVKTPTDETAAQASNSASSPTELERQKSRSLERQKTKSLERQKSRSPTNSDNAAAAPPRKSDEPGWAEKGMNLLFGKK